jgi:preprotein translocase subunit SecG
MTAVLIALNIIAGLFLVAVVLLQAGKGADMGAAFGGANPAAFGPAAQGNVLQKITAATAAVFMGSSLALAVISARQESVFDGASEPAPLAAPVAIPGATPPTDAVAVGEVPASPEAAGGEPAAAAADAAGAATEGAAAAVDAVKEGAAAVQEGAAAAAEAVQEGAAAVAQPSAEAPAAPAAPQDAAPAGAQ